MSNVIVKLRYLNSSKNNKHLKNHIKYISNREGTIKNEDVDLNKYLNYISFRPGAQIGDDVSHGLYDKNGPVREISLTIEDLFSQDDRNIYDMVISLKYDEAKRLQYDNPEKWNDMIIELIPEIAKQSNISHNDLNYQFAIHEHSGKKSFHAHLLFYSDSNNKNGYLNTKNIENVKNTATKIIYQNDLQKSYVLIKDKRLEMHKKINLKSLEKNKIMSLKKKILSQKGRCSYKFLSTELKNEINDCLESLYLKDEKFKEATDSYIKQINVQKKIYGNDNLETVGKLFYPQKSVDQRLHNCIIKNIVSELPENVKYYQRKNEKNSHEYDPFNNSSSKTAEVFSYISKISKCDDDVKENAINLILKKRRKTKNKKSNKPLNNDLLIR